MSAAVLEYAWTLTAFVGLALQLGLLVSAWRDMCAVKVLGVNGDKLAIARWGVGMGVLLALCHGAFVTLGVRALMAPNLPLPWTSAVLIPVGLFMAVSIMLVGVGIGEGILRRKLGN